MRAGLAMIGAALAAGCATTPPAPIDLPPSAEMPVEPQGLNIGDDGDAIALSFSGGGARASAFSLGVLEGLREMKREDGGALLGEVKFISAVSGGAVTAAYYGQHGEAGLDTFRAAYLDKDAETPLNTNPFLPNNWLRLYRGGINPSERLADWLDTEVYGGAPMMALWREDRPRVWINATDLYNRVSFAFTRPYFDALCSDLSRVRVGDAVAASMAVPLAFRPMPIAAHADECAAPLPSWVAAADEDRAAPQLLRATARAFLRYRDKEMMRYVQLVDGGVTDNLGLTTLLTQRRAATSPLGPLSAEDAVRVRRLTFLVVNAEQVRDGGWAKSPEGPNGVSVASAALESAMDSSKRAAFDGFRFMLADWEQGVRAYRCSLKPEQVIAARGGLDGWKCDDVKFTLDMITFADLSPPERAELGAIATRVSLPSDEIDALIAGGRKAVTENDAARALLKAP